MARNTRFSRWAAGALDRMQPPSGQRVVFAYSYAALEIFTMARQRGWTTVLGQIDPGPVEMRLVEALYRDAGQRYDPPPESYWTRWRDEVQLADRIIVNSAWSREAISAEGVPGERIEVAPLAFERGAGAFPPQRVFPYCFSAERPLRALFLGQVTLRKGIGPLLEAIASLADAPVNFTIVGPIQIDVPPEFLNHPRIRWVGPVSRGEANQFYLESDVFLFPTLSDGFGLTQLEAQAAGLPIVASRRCGEVVEHGLSGWLLDIVSPESIASAIHEALASPIRLASMSEAASVSATRFSLARFGCNLATRTMASPNNRIC